MRTCRPRAVYFPDPLWKALGKYARRNKTTRADVLRTIVAEITGVENTARGFTVFDLPEGERENEIKTARAVDDVINGLGKPS